MDSRTKKVIDELTNSNDFKFGKESFIYTFTNENLKQCLAYFDLHGKDILTVTGSGDHVLNMLLSVDKIDTFDINIFAYYFFVLKKYAIAALERDEYLDFLSIRTPNFDLKMFEKIKRVWQSEQEALEFFEYLFHFEKSLYLKKTFLFVNNLISDDLKIYRNAYLEEQNYYALKKDIMNKQVTFHQSDIKTLELDYQFDYIFMSNISDYLYGMFSGVKSKDVLREYKRFLYSNLVPLLKEKGKIVSYLYNGRMQNIPRTEINMVLNYGFTEQPVGKDKILIYEKPHI